MYRSSQQPLLTFLMDGVINHFLFFPYGRVTLMRIVFLLKSLLEVARLALLQSVSTLVRLALLQSVSTRVRRVLLQSVPPHGSTFIHFH